MSRPIYETTQTLETEERLIKLIAEASKSKPIKLGMKYKVDYAMTRNGVIEGWVELKKRSFNSDKYDEYMVSLDKYMTAKRLSEDTGKPCTLVVEFNDKIFIADLSKVQFRLGMGGRKDRGDSEDYEPCCWIPISEFKCLCESPWGHK